MSEIERYKLRVMTLKEITRSESGSMDIQDTTIFFGQCQFDTGFVVHKTLIPTIKNFEDLNPRISVLTLC